MLTPQQQADNAAVIAQGQSALEATRARRNAARTGSVATSPLQGVGAAQSTTPSIGTVPKPQAAPTPVISQTNTNIPTTSNPGNAITQPMPGSASSILGDGFGAEDPFVAQYTQDQLNAYNQTIDPQAAYDEKVKQRQAQIDATNAMYRDQLNQARIRGQGRIGSGTAMQARGGLLGSDFGTAQTNQIQNANTEVENSIEQERLVAVNQILSEAQKDATAEIAAKRAAKEAGGAAYLQYLSDASERKASKTSKAAQLLLSLGKSPQDISDAELKQAGISRQDLTMEYTAGKSAQEAASAAAGLATQKTQAEIDKLAAEGKMPKEVGGYIFDAQGNAIGSKYEKQNANDFLKFETENPDGSKTTYYKNPITGATVSPEQAFGDYGNNVDVSKVLSGYSPKGQELLTVPDGTVIPTRLGQVSPQNASVRGKECAEYVNDIAGTKMGNTYASKVAVCNEPTGGVGSVVAWKPNGSGNFGHTGIVVGEDENNWFVKSSNYVPGTVTTEKVPKSNIKNFYTPESVKSVQQPTEQKAIKYANGNVRTSNGVLVDKADVYKINKDIINDKSYEALTASEDMKTAWDSYKKLVDKYGIEMLPGKAKGEMQTAYNGVLRAAQKFFALGVFQPYDQKAIQEMIPNYVRDLGPFGDTPSHYANPIFRQQLQGQLKGFEDFIQNKIQNEYDSLNRKYGEYKGALSNIDDVEAIYKKVSDQHLISSY